MKCVSCGTGFRFLDGFLTPRGLVCPACRVAAAAAAPATPAAAEALGVRVTLAAQVERAVKEVYEGDDLSVAEKMLQAALGTDEERGAPSRRAGLLWRVLFASARYRTNVSLRDAAREVLARCPPDRRSAYEAGLDLGEREKAIENSGLWLPVALADLLTEDDPPAPFRLVLPAAPEVLAAARAWRPYEEERARSFVVGHIDTSLGREDEALGRRLRDETAHARTHLFRAVLAAGYARATGQPDPPAESEREVDRPGAYAFLEAEAAAIQEALGAVAARSAGAFADVRKRCAARAAKA